MIRVRGGRETTLGERESLDRQVATKQFTFIWTFSKLSIFPLIVLFLKIRFFLKKISLEIKILLYLYFCVLQKKAFNSL